MIKKISMKNIFKYSVLLVVVFLFYLFPEKKEIGLTKEVFEEKTAKYHDIYLIDKNNYVSKTQIVVASEDKNKLLVNLIESLIIDGKYNDRIPNGFRAILPSDTRLLSSKLEKDVAYLYFNDKLLDSKKEYEEKIIESVVYTITSIKGIKNVKIYINDQILNKLPKTGIYFDEELNRSIGINKEYNLSILDDAKKVTVYYVNKNNNNDIYYVPVTKYLNSKEEKIKIIIDELSSKFSYESNLMSYLNYNAKLLDYSFKDNELDMNFNEFLFDNAQNKKVLEEVIYSISYSIEDTYEVSKINFFVNNKEI